MTTPSENISALIFNLSRSMPDRTAIVHGEKTYTFLQLEEEVSALAGGFRELGINRGDRVSLMIPPSFEFVAASFALFRCGAVIVFIDPGIGFANMGKCLDGSTPKVFVGITKAHIGRVLGGWARKSLDTFVTLGPRLGWGGYSLAQVRAKCKTPLPPENTGPDAAVLFTSGSTGAPKGACYTHSIFAEQARLLKLMFDVREGETSVPTFPLFALFDVALGMRAVIPSMDFTRPARANPRHISGLINEFGAAQLFGSPALLDTLSRYGQSAGLKMPSLRRVISCGAPVQGKIIKRVLPMLSPGVQVYTPYGATEALPVALTGSDELLGDAVALSAQGAGVCVGRPVDGVTVRIIAINDGPLERMDSSLEMQSGQTGEIAVSGPAVTASYFRNEKGDALSKIRGEGGAVFHRMGDAGYLDEKGRLWFCGRKSQRVTAGGKVYFTVPCEGVFNAHPAVRRSALVGAGSGSARRPVMLVELEDGKGMTTALEKELLALSAGNPRTADIKTVLAHPAFPVDIRHNAKISREMLSAWAEEKLS